MKKRLGTGKRFSRGKQSLLQNKEKEMNKISTTTTFESVKGKVAIVTGASYLFPLFLIRR